MKNVTQEYLQVVQDPQLSNSPVAGVWPQSANFLVSAFRDERMPYHPREHRFLRITCTRCMTLTDFLVQYCTVHNFLFLQHCTSGKLYFKQQLLYHHPSLPPFFVGPFQVSHSQFKPHNNRSVEGWLPSNQLVVLSDEVGQQGAGVRVACTFTRLTGMYVNAVIFNMLTSYHQWVWQREAHINWSMLTCQGSTRLELP